MTENEYVHKMSLCQQKWKITQVEELRYKDFLILEKTEQSIENKGKNGCGKLCGKCV